jgi:hypothetical protein
MEAAPVDLAPEAARLDAKAVVQRIFAALALAACGALVVLVVMTSLAQTKRPVRPGPVHHASAEAR